MVKLIFQHHYYSLHDPLEIILICGFDAQKTFIIVTNVENSCVQFFSGFFDVWKIQKNSISLKSLL